MWAIPVSVIKEDVRFHIWGKVGIGSRYHNHWRRFGKYKRRKRYSDIYTHSCNATA